MSDSPFRDYAQNETTKDTGGFKSMLSITSFQHMSHAVVRVDSDGQVGLHVISRADLERLAKWIINEFSEEVRPRA